MTEKESGSILASILGIVVCGGLGGVTAWAVVTAAGLGGTFGSIVAAIIGMVVATAAVGRRHGAVAQARRNSDDAGR